MRTATVISIAVFQIVAILMLGFLFLNPAHAGMHQTCPITLVSGVGCPDQDNLPSLMTHYFGGLTAFLSFFASEIFSLAVVVFLAFLILRLHSRLDGKQIRILLRTYFPPPLAFFERARFLYWIIVSRHKQKALRLNGCMA